MKCLVTGSAGFIGSALTKKLARQGYDVKALIHRNKPDYFEGKVQYITGDLTKPYTLKTLIKDIDIVFHCAALVNDFGSKDSFLTINYEGTKNLVKACSNYDIRRFIFLSHLGYESEKKKGYYNISKKLAEKYLLERYERDRFPVVIIRPGNVYGPGATTWILRPLNSIQKNRITLVEGGKGIFLHTYIDNLLDALISAIKVPKIDGEIIEVTDGDNTITWGKYLNDLAAIVGRGPIKRNISKRTALFFGNLMLLLYKIFRIEPWVTPTAVNIFTNKTVVSIDKAKKLLKYEPKVDYKTALEQIRKWIQNENLI